MKGNYISLLMSSNEAWLFSDNNVDASNTVEDKPVYYWIGRTNEAVPEDAGAVILVNCTNVTVKNLVLPKSTYRIILANTNESTVQNNRLVP